ncbi:MAG TPA: hypothetical protein V6D18_07315, partial [Thermosynechococcaceae cyanobacterium]
GDGIVQASEVVSRSALSGTQDESLRKVLEPNIVNGNFAPVNYYVRVLPFNGSNTNYRLIVQ